MIRLGKRLPPGVYDRADLIYPRVVGSMLEFGFPVSTDVAETLVDAARVGGVAKTLGRQTNRSFDIEPTVARGAPQR